MRNAKKHIAFLFVLVISASQIVYSFHIFSHTHFHKNFHRNKEAISIQQPIFTDTYSSEISFEEFCEYCLLYLTNNNNPTFIGMGFVGLGHKNIFNEKKAEIEVLKPHTQKQIIAAANSLRAPPSA